MSAILLWGRRLSEFVPTVADLRSLPHTVVEHIKLKFPHGEEALHYNVLQKLAYLSVHHRLSHSHSRRA